MREQLQKAYAYAGRKGAIVQFRHLGDNEFGSHYAVAVLDGLRDVQTVAGCMMTLDEVPVVTGPLATLALNPKTFASQKMEVLNRVAEHFGRLEYEAEFQRFRRK